MDKKSKADDVSCQVVLRRPKLTVAASSDDVDGGDTGKDGKKKVKWSESTEMRERLKVYRRSQIDIDLDYHHLTIEEEREREGVKQWRNRLNKDETDDDYEANAVGAACDSDGAWAITISGAEVAAAAPCEESNDYDSDEGDPAIDEAFEMKLQSIKEYTTRFTIYPAYSAAIPMYQDWLSKPENTKELSADQINTMKSQIDLYKRLVQIYTDWIEQKNGNSESKFGEVTAVLQEASNLGPPPSSISKAIREALTDEENVQKQVDVYNNMVQDLISALDNSTEV